MEMLSPVYSVFPWLTANPEIVCVSPREFFVGWDSFSEVISNYDSQSENNFTSLI
jgi:hypothetical protein